MHVSGGAVVRLSHLRALLQATARRERRKTVRDGEPTLHGGTNGDTLVPARERAVLREREACTLRRVRVDDIIDFFPGQCSVEGRVSGAEQTGALRDASSALYASEKAKGGDCSAKRAVGKPEKGFLSA
jgi:hypothetical protein